MSSVVQAFTAGGGPNGTPTSALTVSGASISATIPATGPNAQIWNSGTVVIWVSFGGASVAAAPVVPGTPGVSIPIPPNAALVISIPANATTWAAYGASGTIYATFGEGV